MNGPKICKTKKLTIEKIEIIEKYHDFDSESKIISAHGIMITSQTTKLIIAPMK